MTTEESAPAQRRPSRLVKHLLLSLLFCFAMSQTVLGNWDTTYGLWVGWTIAWGVIWLVFAALQVRWWARGDAKFWRPIYAWTLLGYIVMSLIFLPFLIWPRFRRWLFRVLKPADPPEWKLERSIRSLAQLRDDGLISEDEFTAKKADILARVTV